MSRRYDVVIWYKPQPKLSEQLIAHAGRAPDESSGTTFGGDLHWSFEDATDAVRCAESFFEFAALECVTYVAVTSYGDETFGRKIYKDTRVVQA